MEYIKVYEAKLDRELSKYPLLVKIEKQYNVPRTYLFVGIVTLIALMLCFNFLGQLISNLVAWGYPAYASFKAIEAKKLEKTEKPDDNDENDETDKTDKPVKTEAYPLETTWLIYWTVLGFINVVEFFSDFILSWIPVYYFVKTLFFLWLYLPQTNGAIRFYVGFLRPTLFRCKSERSKSERPKSRVVYF